MNETELYLMVPIDDPDIALRFYLDVLGFEKIEYNIYFPEGKCRNVELILMNSDKESRQKYLMLNNNFARYPLFRYRVNENFLSYCKKILDGGGRFDMLIMTPGGYYARVIDPFGNSFEIECDSFNDINDIDTSEWDFYRRL